MFYVGSFPQLRTSERAVVASALCRFCCRSRLLTIRRLSRTVGSGLLRWTLTLCTSSRRCTEPDMVVVGRPALRAAADSERWRRERIHPGRLAGRAAEADQASGCVLNVRT